MFVSYVIKNTGKLTIMSSKPGGVIRGGNCTGDAGGVYNSGNLTIEDITIRDNAAARGGGIFNNGTLTVEIPTAEKKEAEEKKFISIL